MPPQTIIRPLDPQQDLTEQCYRAATFNANKDDVQDYLDAQMPKGVAVGTLAIGDAGAANAGLLAAQILGCQQPEIFAKVEAFRKEQTETILANPNPAE